MRLTTAPFTFVIRQAGRVAGDGFEHRFIASAGTILSRNSTGGILRDGDEPMTGMALAAHLAAVIATGIVAGAITAGVARLIR